jgi:hypothetical protein
MLHSKGVTKMPTNYGVQGPNLGQYGADTQYASPVVGQEEGIPIGGTGAGYLPSQQELRRLSDQNEKRARNQQMVQELQKIMAGIQTTPTQGLNAGFENMMPTPGIGFGLGQFGGAGNQAKAQDMMALMGAPGGAGTAAFGGLVDGILGGGGVGFGLDMGGGNYFGGGDIASFGGSLGMTPTL